MPTNDERRQVAARLRDYATRDFEESNPWWYLSKAVTGSFAAYDDVGGYFTDLADLIEPEPERTCRPVRREIEWPAQEGPRNRVVYECSECEAWIGVTSAYCFNCGARIVREDA